MGLYQNEEEALKFANGRMIKDDDPYTKIMEQIKEQIEYEPDTPEFQREYDLKLI